MTAHTSVPRLRRGVSTGYDDAHEHFVVLCPDGVLLLDETAAAVVGLCDGRTSVREIARRLADRFDGVGPAEVAGVVGELVERQVVDIEGHDTPDRGAEGQGTEDRDAGSGG